MWAEISVVKNAKLALKVLNMLSLLRRNYKNKI